MQEDRRTHERLDSVETLIRNHSVDIVEMSRSLKILQDNTSEIVSIMKGAKGTMTVIWFMAKLFAALTVIAGFVAGVWYAFIHYIQEGIK